MQLTKPTFDQESYNLYRKYQMEIHKDPADKLSVEGYTRFLIDSPLNVSKLIKNIQQTLND